MCTPNADHTLDQHEGGGTSTSHGYIPVPVTPGGPYVADADGSLTHEHAWRFDGDDPYIVCRCGELRDAITGDVIRTGTAS